MFQKIENPTACEMQSVIRFLYAKNVKPAKNRQLCDMYGEHAMSSSMVQRWVRQFNEGRENVHHDLRNGRPSVVNEDLVRAVGDRTDDSPLRHFPCIFLKFHGHFFMKLSDKLKFRKMCAQFRDSRFCGVWVIISSLSVLACWFVVHDCYPVSVSVVGWCALCRLFGELKFDKWAWANRVIVMYDLWVWCCKQFVMT
jgi:hypothetical protein